MRHGESDGGSPDQGRHRDHHRRPPDHHHFCPPWCRADHEADERRRRESVEATARQLAAEGLHVEPVLDTFRVHTVEVSQVTVRADAAEEPAALRVELQQLEDVDGTAGGSTEPRVVLHEPDGWTEDYTLSEPAGLAALLPRPATCK